MRNTPDPLSAPTPDARTAVEVGRASQASGTSEQGIDPEIVSPGATGQARELQAFLACVSEQPHRYDFFHVMRRIEALTPALPRFGHAARPAHEALRIGQEPTLAFVPASISSLETGNTDLSRRGTHDPRLGAVSFAVQTTGKAGIGAARRAPRLTQCFFGFLGPNGPLPLHLTNFARERILHTGDQTFARFLDMLMHRYAMLFYRAVAQADPAASLDRSDDDRFAARIGALLGVGDPSCQRRDAAHDHAKLHYAALFNMQTRPLDGLEAILGGVLRVPVRIEPFAAERMELAVTDYLFLGTSPVASVGTRQGLGAGAVLGARVPGRQHRFRVNAGPLSLAEYESLLPKGGALPVMTALVRQYLNRELKWNARLILRASEVPPIELGRRGRLAWTTWLGCALRAADAADLALDADRVVPMPQRP